MVIYCSIKSNNMDLFALPVTTDKEAHEYIVEKDGGELNVYRISALQDYTWSKRTFDHILPDKNPDTYPVKYAKIKAKEVNDIIKDVTKGFRFSQLFFKVFAAQAMEFISFFLLLIIPGLLAKDRLSNIEDIIHTKPIKARQYILSKIFGIIIPYSFILFLSFVGVGLHHYNKVIKNGFKFNFLDIAFPFFCYVIPCILFTSGFLCFFSLISKYPIISTPIYIFIIFIPYCAKQILYFINVDTALAGGYDIFGKHGSIPPIKLCYGLEKQGLLVCVFIVFMIFSCYIWRKKRSGITERL